MIIDHAAWVIIADSEKFQVFENQGNIQNISLQLRCQGETENPSSREQGSDRPGRLASPHGPLSAVADTDWHTLQKKTAAIDLAQKVNKWAERGLFQKLVLVADPKTLGVMRSKLSADVDRMIIGELAKNLKHHTVEDIERLLEAA